MEGKKVYTMVLVHPVYRPETITFPRDSTPEEIINATECYSKSRNVTVYWDGMLVAEATPDTLQVRFNTPLRDYLDTRKLPLFS